MGARLALLARQFALVAGAALAYFGVRGLTEGKVGRAEENAAHLLRLERFLGIDVEHGLQHLLFDTDVLITLANWVYIWMHWPVVAITLFWLLFRHRDDYELLRNAMFISGAIGLIIFATFPVAPPRLFGLEYVDTVTEQSHSYRVLQPPALVNKYAAVPSLHFGWNLLVGITWARVGGTWRWRAAGIVMPIAMAWAVVATANHWVLDVFVGGLVALSGLGLEHLRRRSLPLRPGAVCGTRDECGTDDREPDSAPAGGPPLAADEATRWHPRLSAATTGLLRSRRIGQLRRRPPLALAGGVDGVARGEGGTPTAAGDHDSDPASCRTTASLPGKNSDSCPSARHRTT
jgi:hypothetical protein